MPHYRTYRTFNYIYLFTLSAVSKIKSYFISFLKQEDIAKIRYGNALGFLKENLHWISNDIEFYVIHVVNVHKCNFKYIKH